MKIEKAYVPIVITLESEAEENAVFAAISIAAVREGESYQLICDKLRRAWTRLVTGATEGGTT